MKTSPLQLDWVAYPEASYTTLSEFDGGDVPPAEIEVEAEVRYYAGGAPHIAFLRICSKESDAVAYSFKLTVVSNFRLDAAGADAAYPGKSAAGRSVLVAVNVARLLYSSAREQLAMMTSRAPYGALPLKSVLIEPSDVKISSPDADPEQILATVFQASEGELQKLREERKQEPQKKRRRKTPESS
ncbi:hypothetical protein ABWU93_11690 [Xanthomonas translucens pv. translucens]|uniref:hypothetical protein n=1 Tax=Xanthomonas campestris pv. translucens TaxID=343 RepID=UPI003F7059BB